MLFLKKLLSAGHIWYNICLISGIFFHSVCFYLFITLEPFLATRANKQSIEYV